MAVVYATDLTFRKTLDGTPATIEQIAAVVGGWAQITNPLDTTSREGRRGSLVQTEFFHGEIGAPRVWRLSLSHRDAIDETTTWTVSVATIEDISTDVLIRLDRTRDGNLLRPTRDNPAPPGCIRELLESDELEVIDGGRRLIRDVWVPDDDEAQTVAELVMSQDRRLPIFAFTLRDDEVIDGTVVSRALAGLAHVVLIRSSLSWILDDLLPTGLNVYGGAARLWWPGLSTSSNRWDHPLWTADVSAQRIANDVVESVVDAAVTHAGADSRITQLERRKRELEHLDREIEMQRLQAQFDEARAFVINSGAGQEVTVLAETIAQLLDVERQARLNAEAERDLMEALGAQVENEMTDTRRRARAAQLERDYWKDQFSRLNDSSSLTIDQNQTSSTFLAEIESEISSRGAVEGSRPRKFLIGKRFMSKIETVGQGNRNKIIKACADVVMNAPGLLSRRDDHSLRSGPGANDPEIQREQDGARARRCAIEQGVASARRVHYWVSPNGVIEFASVNVHDDFAIPN
jgi:hypothetical protein